MKYLVFDNGKYTEFDNWNDCEYFVLDKPNARYRKITSQKVEEEFRQMCNSSKGFVQKIYVVIVEGKVYRFQNWKDAKELIDRNPGCKYKSFESEEEAQAFSNTNVHQEVSEDTLVCEIKQNGDILLLRSGQVVEKTTIKNSKNSLEMELNGALAGIRKAISMGEEQILIRCHNLGTEMWANGTWATNKEYSKAYKEEIDELKKRINIDFRMV